MVGIWFIKGFCQFYITSISCRYSLEAPHNVTFYGEISKIICLLSQNVTHCSQAHHER